MSYKVKHFENEIKCIENKNHYDKLGKNNSSFRRKFLEFYEEKCVYCGVSIKPNNKIVKFEIDHIYPRKYCNKNSKVGSFDNDEYILKIDNVNDISNLVVSCSFCNNKKSNKLLLRCFHPDFVNYSDFIHKQKFEFTIVPGKEKDIKIHHLIEILSFTDDKRFHINVYDECIVLLNKFQFSRDINEKNSIVEVLKKLIDIYDKAILYKTL